MDKKEFSFRFTIEWSDHPGALHSPSTTGELPQIAVLPGGQRVDCSLMASESARWQEEAYQEETWVVLLRDEQDNPVLSHSYGVGGDDPSRPCGRSTTTVRILAPSGTKFEF